MFYVKNIAEKMQFIFGFQDFFQYFYCNNKIIGKLGRGSIRPSLL